MKFRGSMRLAMPYYIVDNQVGQYVQNIGLGRAAQPVLETLKIFQFAKGPEFFPRHFFATTHRSVTSNGKIRRSPNHLCIGLTIGRFSDVDGPEKTNPAGAKCRVSFWRRGSASDWGEPEPDCKP